MADDTGLYLGRLLDTPDETRMQVDREDLTTHGVIVGMTGSGKTGLGVVLLEEVLDSGVPALILDPKGDMGNLLLNFPQLRGADFEPWVDPAEARREGIEVTEHAERTAATWAKGLARSGVTRERMAALQEGVDMRIFTPGSTAGTPLNLVGDLSARDADWGQEGETLRDEIEGLVSGILVMAGIDADPLTSREHILLSNLVEHAWRHGEPLDLPRLIGQIQTPPFRRLGVFELDTFYPAGDRMKLAMRMNGLVASPSFAEWMKGEPASIETLLRAPDGRPRASIIYLAHLSETERLFVVTLLLSRLVTWMRTQPGTSDLRALVYADEVMGFAPPTASPPTKRPLLTLFKQARAHGLGLVMSTQNPVDLDYKLMSNAGTWMIGRLQTERDKARIIEGLKSASGEVDVGAWDARIGQLGKREFLLKSTRSAAPVPFTTRWAMSYLRGPLTRSELLELSTPWEGPSGDGSSAPTGGRTAPTFPRDSAPSSGAGRPSEASTPTELEEDETPVAPPVDDDTLVGYLAPDAPWRRAVAAAPGPRRLEPGLAVRVCMRFDERVGDVDVQEEWEAVVFPLEEHFDPGAAVAVDHDERDFDSDPPEDATWRLTGAPLDSSSFLRDASRDLRDHLYRTRALTLQRNAELRLVSRPAETEAEFAARCLEAAENEADEEASKLRDRYESKLRTAEKRHTDAERRARDLAAEAARTRQDELVTGAGQVLSMFLGGRRRTSGLSSISRRRSQTLRAQDRVRTAEQKVDDLAEEILRIEAELVEELDAIWEEWKEVAGEIEEMEVPLEKNDIQVESVRLFWAARA